MGPPSQVKLASSEVWFINPMPNRGVAHNNKVLQ